MWFRIRGGRGLSNALVACRKEAGLSQAAMSERLHVDRTTVVRMERGGIESYERLARAFSFAGYDLIAVPRSAEVTVTPRGTGGGPAGAAHRAVDPARRTAR